MAPEERPDVAALKFAHDPADLPQMLAQLLAHSSDEEGLRGDEEASLDAVGVMAAAGARRASRAILPCAGAGESPTVSTWARACASAPG